MFNTRQTILASRPAAMVLALALVAGLTAPVLMLPRAHAAPAAPASPCAEVSQNGCTEMSATPPQDTEAVPPNIELMLDDSGSMDWDFMPDWGYLKYNTAAEARDPLDNTLYYDSTKTYIPPPQADSVPIPPPAPPAPPPTIPYTDPYPASPGLTNAYSDGFTSHAAVNIENYAAPNSVDIGHQYAYYTQVPTGTTTTTPPPVLPTVCPGGFHVNGGQCVAPAPTGGPNAICPAGYTYMGGGKCQEGELTAPAQYKCPGGWTPAGFVSSTQVCTGPVPAPKPEGHYCPGGSTYNAGTGMCDYNPVTTTHYINVFTYVVDPGAPVGSKTPTAPASLGPMTYYVAAGTAGNNCSLLTNAAQKAHCVDASDTSGAAAPAGVAAGQNIANWFSYYRTRLLMAKTGLMTAFVKVDKKYRLGFGSINGNGVSNIPGAPGGPAGASSTPPPAAYQFDDRMANGQGGSATNQLAAVQPFGTGSAGCPDIPGAGATCTPASQKDFFWNWVAKLTANDQTPLRLALNAVGQYYETAQPWTAMSSDPGWPTSSGTQFACRAAYTILTTDGFWNGDDPVGRAGPPTPASLLGAANVTGPTPANSVPASDTSQYLANAPYSGPYSLWSSPASSSSSPFGAVGVDATGNPTGGQVPSLADVATYYWETDLQPGLPNEVAPSASDPAAWQHMTTFTIGLGFTPVGIQGQNSSGQNASVDDIFTWASGDPPTGPVITNFSWPTAYSNGIYNIADLAHAALNGHGEFFNVTKPNDLANALAKAFSDIAARSPTTPAAGVNSSVLALGALSFTTGYETVNWSGTFKAVTLNADGTTGATAWDAGANLNAQFHSGGTFSNRSVWTDAYTPAGAFSPFQFDAGNVSSLDATETAGLGGSSDCAAGGDSICNRIDYLLGDPTHEGMYRTRTLGILGAIIRSQPVYVAGATGNYSNDWPAGSPELTPAQTWDAFVAQQAAHQAMVYVGANDGMLHAFDAPVPTCTGIPPTCDYHAFPPPGDGDGGEEAWAFIPRAVYANLGNLVGVGGFHFLPTVDATPVTRDVFFSDNKWHTLLAGGVGMGGRGVYALDITNPASFSRSDVLWEFDSDSSTAGCISIVGVSVSGSCAASDLGFTLSQPNIGRLNYNDKWVVLVPNGYFPDCTTPDIPTATIAACQAIAAQAPGYAAGAPYSALFVLDAQTGSVIAELKTPTIAGVTSFGLATPVMGDYVGNQVDAVAFAGDVEGNLWRFDLSETSPSSWSVTLVYKAPVQGAQPITTMPRLFPDPTTNRFMVVFGTGKLLGIGDNADNTVQGVYGVRDPGNCSTDDGCAVTQTDLTQQYLHEETPASGPYAGINLRCITGSAADTSCTSSPTPVNTVPAASAGWFFNLQTTTGSPPVVNDAGERVVATPAAVFATNTVVVGTLITGSQTTDACDPSTQGAIMALNVLSGGTSGVSSLGGGLIAGARITNALTSGSVSILSQVGGAQGLPAGTTLLGGAGGTGPGIDIPLYRRRSWQEINPNQ